MKTNKVITFSSSISTWLRKTKLAKTMGKMVVNHLGLTLTKEDLKNMVDLMEPYGQITNGIEYLTPPIDELRARRLQRLKRKVARLEMLNPDHILKKNTCCCIPDVASIETGT